MNEELLKRLDAIALKVGTTATQLWGVLIRQARVEMWQDIGWMVGWLAVCGLSAWGVRWLLHEDEPSANDGPIVILAGVCVFAVLAAAYCGQSAITEGINPQYWAFKQLLGMLK